MNNPNRSTGLLAVAVMLALLGTVITLALLDTWIAPKVEVALPPEESFTADKLQAERLRTEFSHERYRQWAYYDYQQSYSWQNWSTRIIFWVSMLITLTGLGLSSLQFITASNEARGALQLDKGSEQELQISSQLISLAFKTRSIAAFIMFMSLVYLVIYVLFLHPIAMTTQVPQVTPSPGEHPAKVLLSTEIPQEMTNDPQD